MHDDGTAGTCVGCGGARGRREFLRRAALLVAGSVAGHGGAAQAAPALPVAFGAALGASGAELTYPIPGVDGATVDRGNGVIVVRHQGRVFAFNLSCPHENAAVRWKAAVNRFECSRHDSTYQPDGLYRSGRATRNLDRFAVRRDGAALVVDVSRLVRSDTQQAQWEAAWVAL